MVNENNVSTESEEIATSDLGDSVDSATEGETLPAPDLDIDSVRGEVASAAAGARAQADLAAIRKATSHIPNLQSRLDAVEKATRKVEALEQSSTQLASRLDSLLGALGDAGYLTPSAVSGLRPERGDSNSDLIEKIEELEQRLTRGNEQAPDVDPAQAEYEAAWNAATASVERYATAKGYDASNIPDAVWSRAYSANPNDPTNAALEVARYVESQIAAEARRNERKDAAAGGTGERAVRKGALTPDSLKKMSVEEIMAIPREERDKINFA